YLFNKLLLIFLIIYFIFALSINKIYLDTTISVKLNDLNFNISGEYINNIFTHFGAATAFVIGSRLAATFLMKHPMSLGGKIGITIGSGAGSSAAFQMVNYTSGSIKGKILAQQGLNDNSINLHIKDVIISDGNNLNNIVNIETSNIVNPINLIPKHQISLEKNISNFNTLNDKLNVINIQNLKSNIIQMIEKQNNCSLNEIFSKENNIDNIIINSSL